MNPTRALKRFILSKTFPSDLRQKKRNCATPKSSRNLQPVTWQIASLFSSLFLNTIQARNKNGNQGEMDGTDPAQPDRDEIVFALLSRPTLLMAFHQCFHERRAKQTSSIVSPWTYARTRKQLISHKRSLICQRFNGHTTENSETKTASLMWENRARLCVIIICEKKKRAGPKHTSFVHGSSR